MGCEVLMVSSENTHTSNIIESELVILKDIQIRDSN